MEPISLGKDLRAPARLLMREGQAVDDILRLYIYLSGDRLFLPLQTTYPERVIV